MRTITPWCIGIVLWAASAACAQQTYLVLDEDSGGQPRTQTRQIPLAVNPSETKLYLKLHVTLTGGQVTLRLLDPNGDVLRQDATGNLLSVEVTQPVTKAGTYHLALDEQAAVGKLQISIYPVHAG